MTDKKQVEKKELGQTEILLEIRDLLKEVKGVLETICQYTRP